MTELGLSLNKNCIYKIQKFQIGSYQKGTSGSTYSVSSIVICSLNIVEHRVTVNFANDYGLMMISY